MSDRARSAWKWIGSILAALFFFANLGGSAVLSGPMADQFFRASAPQLADLRTYLDWYVAGRYANLEATLDPEINRKSADASLRHLHSLLPRSANPDIRVVGFQMNWDQGVLARQGSFELSRNGVWALVQITTASGDGGNKIVGLYVTPLTQSLERANAFLRPEGAGQILLLMMAILIGLCAVVTTYAAIFAPGIRRRWLWALLANVGIVHLTVNWTSGETNVQPIWIGFPVAGISHSAPALPWSLLITLPLGVIFFWTVHWNTQSRAVTAPQAPAETVPPALDV